MSDISTTYMNLDRHLTGLSTFDLVSNGGNFTKAANILGITQSAVSQRINDLETDLDVVLFNREHRGVSLTDEGVRLISVVGPAMNQLGEVLSELQQRKTKQKVRLSLDFAFATFWLLPRLPHLRDELDGEIDIQILASQTPVNTAAGDCDMTVHMCTEKAMTNQDVVLFPEWTIAVCSPDFLIQNGPFSAAEDLLKTQLLSLSAPHGSNWHSWQSWFQALNVTGAHEREFTSFSNYDLIIRAATSGQGVALGWVGLIDKLLESGTLVRAIDQEVRSDIGYVLSRNRKSNLAGPQKVFDWIAANANTPSQI